MIKKKLKIALFCTTHFSIPLRKSDDIIYAPINLTSELIKILVKRGHKVTLFASSDSKTAAELVSCNQISFAHHPYFKSKSHPLKRSLFYPYEQHLIAHLYSKALRKKFDIIHNFDTPFTTLPFTYLSQVPTLTTLHDPADNWRVKLLKIYQDSPTKFISLSDSQKKEYSRSIKCFDTVYNGLKIDDYSYNENSDDYLLATSRFIKEKGLHIAIKVAVAAKHKLIIAGIAYSKHEKEYFKKEVEPLIKKNSKYIKNCGLVNRKELINLYKNAKALLFPIQWEEPFGMVMIEAMACGTPVIAFKRGSVPEIIKNGKTGFIIPPLNKNGKPNFKEFVKAIKKIDQIDRQECRRCVEENFTTEKMADEYEKVYYRAIKNCKKK